MITIVNKTKTNDYPMIMRSNRFYFVDHAERQFRNVMDQWDYVDFDTIEGKEWIKDFDIVITPSEGDFKDATSVGGIK
ncbi:MAG: hypothetical protein GY869_24945 [Planctomycetes bacterium]|nr:hypothetical protein [Planctomycetota bacterium]